MDPGSFEVAQQGVVPRRIDHDAMVRRQALEQRHLSLPGDQSLVRAVERQGRDLDRTGCGERLVHERHQAVEGIDPHLLQHQGIALERLEHGGVVRRQGAQRRSRERHRRHGIRQQLQKSSERRVHDAPSPDSGGHEDQAGDLLQLAPSCRHQDHGRTHALAQEEQGRPGCAAWTRCATCRRSATSASVPGQRPGAGAPPKPRWS
jgi:hypothetical protein